MPALMHAHMFELLSRVKGSTAHVVGFSLGGGILATFAALHPQVVASVNLVAGAGLWKKHGSGGWSGVQVDGAWILDERSEQVIMDQLEGDAPSREGWKERFKNGAIESDPIERWERENHPGHKASVISIFRYGNIFAQHESYRKLAESNLKILVIVGDYDSSFPPEFVRRS